MLVQHPQPLAHGEAVCASVDSFHPGQWLLTPSTCVYVPGHSLAPGVCPASSGAGQKAW